MQLHQLSLNKLMKQRLSQNQMKRSNRNSSDIDKRFKKFQLIDDPYIKQEMIRIKKNSIKINRNKLPPDFFPRTQSLRRQVYTTRQPKQQLIQQAQTPLKQLYRKAESQKNQQSPDKTSFFSFFEQIPKIKKNLTNFMNLKRDFESWNQPKRQKIKLQQRNFTPLSGNQRAEMITIFPVSHDRSTLLNSSNSKKMKDFKGTFKSQLNNITKQIRQIQLEDPQIQEIKKTTLNNSFKTINTVNNHNITFFNTKSVSFPPIVKQGEQH